MSADVFFLYLGAWTLVAIAPGPAVMCAMSHSTRFGFRHALVGIAGIQLGHLVFFGCVAFGLAAVLSAATTGFTILRIVGALYLLYLGVRIVASTFVTRKSRHPAAHPPDRSSLLLQGFAIQVTNPKALLFMSALLPQFIQPQYPLPAQLLVLLATTIAVDTLVLSAYAYFALRGAESLRASGFSVWLERTFGAALIVLGIRLLASRK
jgi:threonine/homoserine/homoserine lactone efflux protein